ncbi:hypothetical protein PUNSTDRAFT_132949 [Punctularia strigosozonata HHB-11173 SS5]|uniref:uncharacterized protein n=1 Tax=Punctularia strigosozonata (strain HHB-11173) TaxID=741275 RepID=UPI00044173EA|nr:uncharacterized protein PUNSTDRAFT_132949 [Punctularia strigosozonata HHB-11173 SS5]EIN10886.1 hypothetical protein PUNSTDRAFT_132949 [Punctularia strigosozonata HHB-11173 SS5]
MAANDDEEVNAEMLQAQIDMAMSFTHELVSSWIKPSAGSKRKRASAQHELEAIMKRPARLGVGAPTSDGSSLLNRDAARLKGRLTASGVQKRPSNLEVSHSRQGHEDDSEDSRAGAIRKKAKSGGPPISKMKPKRRGKDGGEQQAISARTYDEITASEPLRLASEKTEGTSPRPSIAAQSRMKETSNAEASPSLGEERFTGPKFQLYSCAYVSEPNLADIPAGMSHLHVSQAPATNPSALESRSTIPFLNLSGPVGTDGIAADGNTQEQRKRQKKEKARERRKNRNKRKQKEAVVTAAAVPMGGASDDSPPSGDAE